MATSGISTSSFLLVLTLLALLSPALADEAHDYVYGTDAHGVTRKLSVDRTPALYTGDFSDCLGGESLFNVTLFNAAFYTDDPSIGFEIGGTTNIKNESLMLYLSVNAYGTERFSMTVDPCLFNANSLCPLNASVPITAWASIPVGPLQVGWVPSIAFRIPDFEGAFRIQIFANSSQTEIGCFQAVMKNGASFAHPAAVAPVLGVFTLVAVAASFVTAAYGVSVPHMRMHHAHSLSVLLVFEVFQTVFFSGALSVRWPSVLVAWWSNFAWSAGQIRIPALVDAVGPFTGVSGNASQVGGAGSVVINNGGGLASQIYGRSLDGGGGRALNASVSREAWANVSDTLLLQKRADTRNASTLYYYPWAGRPVAPGMPTPGTWSGFPGDLAGAGIPAADAFLVGLIWFLIAVAAVALSVTLLKGILELLARAKRIQPDRLAFFRRRWVDYLVQAVLRAFYVGFFMMVTLSLYQLNLPSSPGPTALAAVVLALFLLGVGLLVGLACRARLRDGTFSLERDRIILQRGGRLFGVVPCALPVRASSLRERELEARPLGSLPFFRLQHTNRDPARPSAHQDVAFVTRFGWLSAKYRRTRWWAFAYYPCYQLVRACFVGGAVRSPLAQVYGLLLVEVVAFAAAVKLDPFEGARNTALAVWMLGIAKVVSTALSIAFLPQLALDRIVATVLGIIIILVQGALVIGLLILVVLGAVSSYMSLTRNRADFKPESLEGVRYRYFENMQRKAPDVPVRRKTREEKAREKEEARKKKEEAAALAKVPKEPYFAVTSVRRAPKIEDEDVREVPEEEDEEDVGERREKGDGPEEQENGDVLTSLGAPSPSPVPHSGGSGSYSGGGPSPLAAADGALPPPPRIANRSSRTNSLSSRYSSGSLRRQATVAAAAAVAGGLPPGTRPPRVASREFVPPSPSSPTPDAQLEGSGGGTSRPTSPGLVRASTPSRDTLRRHAEERRFSSLSVPPPAPDSVD